MKPASVLPVLMYHHVSTAPGLVTVSPQAFREQMQYLVQHGWTTLGAAGVEDFFAGRPVPKKSVVVTFDDGYLDNYVYAHPVLTEFGQTAMLFVVTGWVGDGPARAGDAACPDHKECKRRIAAGQADSVMLRWSEVEVMRVAGSFEFHSHTHTHTRWDKSLSGESRIVALIDDLRRSREALASRLGAASRHLCWPQGYYEPGYVDAAIASGFDHLYTTARHANPRDGDPRRIGRIVTKERSGAWLGRRLAIYRRPWLAGFYNALRSDDGDGR